MDDTLHNPGDIWEIKKNGKVMYAVQFCNKIMYYDTLDKAEDISDSVIEVLYNNPVFNF